jgi:hypothetical protein
VPTLGGAPRRVASASYIVPSADGASIFCTKLGSSGIFRAGKSGLNEELVYNPEGAGVDFIPLLLFPGGKDILSGASSNFWEQHSSNLLIRLCFSKRLTLWAVLN